jgi:type I restriction enzyme S subunit
MMEFVRMESPLLKAIEHSLCANQKLIAIRDKLLPRLISGKLSVEDLDIQFPPGMVVEMNGEAFAPATASRKVKK